MKWVKTYESFLFEDANQKKLTDILSNLTKDPGFIEFLHSKGKTQIQKVSSAELSMGLCTYVAKYVEEIHGIGKAMGSHGPPDLPVSHAFIVYKNRYYDASSPKGEKNVWQLWNFDDASYATTLPEDEYNKLIQKNVQPFELKK
jgi:hypothetical protein